MYNILITFHVIVTVLLIGIILIQRSDGDGFGTGSGGGAGSFMTGRSTANFLTRTTAILATFFILSSLGLTLFIQHGKQASIADQIVKETPAPISQPPAADASQAPASKTKAAVPAKASAGTAPAKASTPETAKTPAVPRPE